MAICILKKCLMNISDTKIFKTHPKYTRYKISNFGKVVNIKTNRILKPCVINKGYLSLEMFKDSINKGVTVKLHRIIAETFLGKKDGFVIDHIDNNKSNNHINNLHYVSNRYNIVKQKIFSKNGFIRKNNGAKKITFTIEFRLNGKKVNYTSNNEMDCIIYYCSAISSVDMSVVNLLKNYYEF